MNRKEAEICVTVDIGMGFRTGSFVIYIHDCNRMLIYTHVVTSKSRSFIEIASYINKNFVDSKRFENIRAVYNTRNDTFMYFGIDTKRRDKVCTEKWEDVGIECPWYEALFEDAPNSAQMSLDMVH